MFRLLFTLHVLGAALLVGWLACDSILRAYLGRQRVDATRAGLMSLSFAFLNLAHAAFALALLTGAGLVLRSGGLAAVPGHVRMKMILALGLVLALGLGARSARRARRALLRVRNGTAEPRELDTAFAATGTWARVLGFGYLLSFLIGLLRPGT